MQRRRLHVATKKHNTRSFSKQATQTTRNNEPVTSSTTQADNSRNATPVSTPPKGPDQDTTTTITTVSTEAQQQSVDEFEDYEEFCNDTLKSFVDGEITNYKASIQNVDYALNQIDELKVSVLSSLSQDEKGRKKALVKEHFRVRQKLLNLKETISTQVEPGNQTSHSDNGSSFAIPNTKLPKLQLQKFDGDPLEWTSFWETFDSAVNSNGSLQSVEKFAYLREHLEGSAASTIAGFSLTNANYNSAIDLLRTRFGQPQLVISAHVTALLDLPVATYKSLRETMDIAERHIRSLEGLGITSSTYGMVIAPVLLKKFPKDVIVQITRDQNSPMWDLDELRKRLNAEIDARVRYQSEFGQFRTSDISAQKSKAATFITKGSRKESQTFPRHDQKQGHAYKCRLCSGSHRHIECPLTTTQKRNAAKSNKLCFCCLRTDHQVKDCTYKDEKCRFCQKAGHHVALCEGSQPNTTDQHKVNSNQPDPPSATVVRTTLSVSKDSHHKRKGIIPTAVATAKARDGSTVKVRVAFDYCSDVTYVTRPLTVKCGFPKLFQERLSINSFGNDAKHAKAQSYDVVTAQISSQELQYPVKIEAFVVPIISSGGTVVPQDAHRLPEFRSIRFATDASKDCGPIDVLIGQDHLWDFLEDQVVRSSTGFVAQKTKLGWVVMGCEKAAGKRHDLRSSTTSFLTLASSPEVDVGRFWDLESLGISDSLPRKQGSALLKTPFKNDTNASVHTEFLETIDRDIEGRYMVSFPWKDCVQDLPTNRELALAQFKSLKRRLSHSPQLASDYYKIMEEQLRRGFIVPVSEDLVPSKPLHYIPHHPVFKEESATTKMRIVYNASAKAPDSLSLNQCLHKGPDLLVRIPEILLRFREKQVGLVSDIEKAFLMLSLNPKDQDCTRFFWFTNYNEKGLESPIGTFRFARVPFGIICSPFCLNATLKNHLDGLQGSEPLAGELLRSLYVDNSLVSVDGTDEALQFYATSKELMHKAQMNLREWSTNENAVRQAIPDKDRSSAHITKVLGLYWDPSADQLMLRKPSPINFQSVTKRSVAQHLNSIFDPLGFASPVVVRGKIFFQKLWTHNLNWDDYIGDDLNQEWKNIVTSLTALSSMRIPRQQDLPTDCPIDLHIFADASPAAYGTAIYGRYENADHEVWSSLIASKSRVAPLKGLTLPNLELMAILVGVRLASFILANARNDYKQCIVWSDSTIALSWISNDTDSKAPFVANRVREIRGFPANYRHVKSKDNPADPVSRGTNGSFVLSDDTWLAGPQWFRQPAHTWPRSSLEFTLSESVTAVTLQTTTTASGTSPKFPFGMELKQFGSLGRLLRVTAYCLKFIRLLRNPAESRVLDAEILQQAKTVWDKSVQKDAFGNSSETYRLFKQMNAFVDADGLVRCRGRIDLALNVSNEAKNPKLLPKDHHFTTLVIRKFHQDQLHQGVRHTLNAIRQEYWICRGRATVAQVVRKCVVCRFWGGYPYKSVSPPPLPRHRVAEAPPFSYVGIDYIGPIYAKEEIKTWICLITCAVTRAVYLDLVPDLTTAEFLLVFRRFVARRGCPEVVVSDNAKTFHLADKTISNIWRQFSRDQAVNNYISSHGIKWIFNADRAPWWGGFFEKMVDLVKRCLKKSIGKAHLWPRELMTQLAEVEAVLNTRPLTFVYSDNLEGQALCPNDLLNQRLATTFPGLGVLDKDEDFIPTMSQAESYKVLTKRMQHLQQVTERFWRNWRDEYLLQLREHSCKHAFRGGSDYPQEGDVVLIKENLPRAQWRLGLVTKLLPGKDGQVRAVKLKCKNNEITRPTALLYPLEVQDEEEHKTREQSKADKSSSPEDFTSESSAKDALCARKQPERLASTKARKMIKQVLEDENELEED